MTYSSLRQPNLGIQYTDQPSKTLLDVCVIHVTGKWWISTWDRSELGNCPDGYSYKGGP